MNENPVRGHAHIRTAKVRVRTPLLATVNSHLKFAQVPKLKSNRIMNRDRLSEFVGFYAAVRFTVYFIETEYIQKLPRPEQTMTGVIGDISIVLITAVVSSVVFDLFQRWMDRP